MNEDLAMKGLSIDSLDHLFGDVTITPSHTDRYAIVDMRPGAKAIFDFDGVHIYFAVTTNTITMFGKPYYGAIRIVRFRDGSTISICLHITADAVVLSNTNPSYTAIGWNSDVIMANDTALEDHFSRIHNRMKFGNPTVFNSYLKELKSINFNIRVVDGHLEYIQ